MHRLATALLLLSALNASAFATTPQERMKSCNADATTKALKGDERKAFMSTCLKAETKPTTPQERMKTCNADATSKTLKGDERKAFMSECLKKK